MTLLEKLKALYADRQIHFAWNYTHDGWECMGEQISERGQDQLVSFYMATDPSFYGEALIDAEERASACIDDGDALALGFLVRDSLRKQAVDWATRQKVGGKSVDSDEWARIKQWDLENEKYPQAEGY